MLDTAIYKKLKTGIPVIEYYIGVDVYEKDTSSYCLVRHVNGIPEILLSKVLRMKRFLKRRLRI